MWNVQCIIWKGRFHYDSPACFSCSIAKKGEKRKKKKGRNKDQKASNAHPKRDPNELEEGMCHKGGTERCVPAAGCSPAAPWPRRPSLSPPASPPPPISSPPPPPPLPPIPSLRPLPTHFLLKAAGFSLASLSSSVWTCQISRSRPCRVCRTCWQVALSAQGEGTARYPRHSSRPPLCPSHTHTYPPLPSHPPPAAARPRPPHRGGSDAARRLGLQRGSASGVENSTHAEITARTHGG